MHKAAAPHHPARHPPALDVRAQIVAAATEHFRLYGYQKTTVSDLARAIGFSKAYIYKFFASKQAIGELICANCLLDIEMAIQTAVDAADAPSEKLLRLFKTAAAASLRLFCEQRKLHEIAAAAVAGHWEVERDFERRIRALLRQVLQQGRDTEEFERKTPLDEAAEAIHLVLRPYLNPLLLQYSIDSNCAAPAGLPGLVLRSLSPDTQACDCDY